MSRFTTIWNKSGVMFTIHYGQEVFRLVGNFLAGQGVSNDKTWVKQYKNGLPKILGEDFMHLLISLKKALDEGYKASPFDRALISVLAFFRALSPPNHIAKFGTLTEPFKGLEESFSKPVILAGLKSMGALSHFKNLKLNSPTYFWSNKSGVNARFAYLSIGLDLVALMRNPSIWWGHLKFAFHFSFYLYIVIFVTMSFILLPFLITPIDLYLGRIGLIKELRGKCRIIGITDQWTQWLFRPLHDSIYSFLGTLPEDGTNDQLGPVNRMLDLRRGSLFYSLDLSAATDRLPVSLQADILDALGLNGKVWRQILKRPYYYESSPKFYEVGQPMGAYSSFAMLALTNHLIMHCAHLRTFGNYLVQNQGLYAILGDDVVIADNKLALSYKVLMDNYLGVVINPIKGFEGKLIEFAKNWIFTTGVNLTPLGSKSILRTSRSPLFITSLLADYNKKDFHSILKLELSVLTTLLDKLFDKKGLSSYKWLFSILGPQGGFWRLSSDNLDVKSKEFLFREVIDQIGGFSFTDVTEFYYSKLTKSSWTSYSSLRELIISYWKLFLFILAPQLWSKNKMKSLGLDIKYTAVLTTATVSIISIPLLILSLLRAIRVWTVLWIVSGVGSLFGFAYISKYFVLKFYDINNRIKRWFHNFLLNKELVDAGYASPMPFTVERAKKPINRVLNSSLLFSRWMLGMKTLRPIQLLVDRVRILSDDELPAIKTAEKFLYHHNKEYKQYHQKVKSEMKRIHDLKKSKVKTSGSKRKRS
nr:MAG: putative RNA dependent RNA polymerase [Xinjiang mito-like virus 46]